MTILATCAFQGTNDPDENVRRHVAYMDEAADAGAALIVFPECGIQGYPDRKARSTSAGFSQICAAAEDVELGRLSRVLTAHAVRRRLYVVYGMTEAGPSTGVVYNTAVLAGPEGLIGSYRKVHLGQTEQTVWAPGHQWPVLATRIGNIGLLICADKAWPESTRELALGGAELLVMPTAWAFDPAPADDVSMPWKDYYLLFDRARAAENMRWFVSSNYIGSLGDTLYGGHSQIVNPYGAVIATSESRAGLVLAEVDIRGGIAEAERSWPGAGMLRDRRVDTYRRQQVLSPPAEPGLSPSGSIG